MAALDRLNALRAFEAVARHGSYARAARELNVTPAAVGQHVRSLEDWLGLRLFTRVGGPQRLVLTHRAERASSELRAALAAIERAVAGLRSPERVVLTITASQAFVAKWLMARLEGFTSTHPSFDVRLDVSDRVLDVAQHEGLVAIRCGEGPWPGAIVTKLMREELFPVCAPALVRRRRLPVREVDLARLPRIHDGMQSVNGTFPTWAHWLARHGVTASAGTGGLRVNSSVAAIQAAIGGSGVALARSVLVRDDLERGLLVRPCGEAAWRVSSAYWLARSHASDALPEVQAFCAWLTKTCRQEERAAGRRAERT